MTLGLTSAKLERGPVNHWCTAPRAPKSIILRAHNNARSTLVATKRTTKKPTAKTRTRSIASHTHVEVVLGLNAAILALSGETPQVLVGRQPTTQDAQPIAQPADALPYGPFEPATHRTLELGLRTWVNEQTGLGLGYVEQLYTFGDRGRLAGTAGAEPQVVSIGYLALTENVPLCG
jgi:hypothetical protein